MQLRIHIAQSLNLESAYPTCGMGKTATEILVSLGSCERPQDDFTIRRWRTFNHSYRTGDGRKNSIARGWSSKRIHMTADKVPWIFRIRYGLESMTDQEFFDELLGAIVFTQSAVRQEIMTGNAKGLR